MATYGKTSGNTTGMLVHTFTWTNCTTTGVAPDTDDVIDIRGAVSIAIQVNSTAAAHTASDWDLNIITCPTEGGTFDTTVYTEKNFGDNIVQTFLVTAGAAFMKLTCDENGALRADPTVIVFVRY